MRITFSLCCQKSSLIRYCSSPHRCCKHYESYGVIKYHRRCIKITPFWYKKYKNFLGRGHDPLPRPRRPRRLRRSTCGAPFRWIGHPPLWNPRSAPEWNPLLWDETNVCVLARDWDHSVFIFQTSARMMSVSRPVRVDLCCFVKRWHSKLTLQEPSCR